MTDVWAASLFANSSAEEDSGSKALRAARAHAWGGDCPLTHPSLTFPTWSPVKRIDMMCGARAARATSSHAAAGTRSCMRREEAGLWRQTLGLTRAALSPATNSAGRCGRCCESPLNAGCRVLTCKVSGART